MKRRVTTSALLLTIFLVAELMVVFTVQAEQHTLTTDQNHVIIVDKHGNGDYRTIQQAINNAAEGATIMVKAGEYNEILNIKKKIGLIGEDREQTIINPISEENKYALRLGAPGITIKGLSISNGAPGLYSAGIRISAANTEVHNCNFYDNPLGIAIWTSGNIITNCTFWNCEDEGIALLGSSRSLCNNNTITNSIFHHNCDGIELQHSSDNIIKDCKFYENTHTGIDAIASRNDRNIIENCDIYNNEVHGIYLSSSVDNQIIDCSVVDNRDGDIVMNKYAKNNQIISHSNSEEEPGGKDQLVEEPEEESFEAPVESKVEPAKEDIISSIVTVLSHLNIQRIILLFTFYNF
jgi:parallel beta-helix repeat protein